VLGKDRRFPILVSVASALMLALVWAGAAHAAARPVLVAPAKAPVARSVVFTGSAAGRARAKVVLDERRSGGWRRRASGRASRSGAFRLTWRRAKPGKVRVRVRARAGGRTATSRASSVRFSSDPALRTTAPVLTPKPGTVRSAPAPGASGVLRLERPLAARAGDVVAIAVGRATPAGLLAEVGAIRDGGTRLAVKPAVLREVVPEGSLRADIKAEPVAGAARRLLAAQCQGTGSVGVTGSAAVEASVRFAADWGILSLSSASLVGDVTASASVSADASAQGSCTLAPQLLWSRTLTPKVVTVGVVPVVLVPRVRVALSGTASVAGALRAGVDASLRAEAGVEYRDGDFSPVGGLTPAFSVTHPDPSIGASAAVTVSPSVDVLVYGIAGPELAFNAGLALDSALLPTPCHSFTAPLSLVGRLTVPALDLESGDLTIWSQAAQLAGRPGCRGDGNEQDPDAPEMLSDAVAIATGDGHSCAIRVGGQVVCWGYANQWGQVGDGTYESRLTPVPVNGLTDAVQLVSGGGDTCALRASGIVACWGLAAGGSGASPTPQAVTGTGTVVAISAGGNFRCVIRDGGQTACWGSNDAGQMGDGTTSGAPAVPQVVPGVDAVAIGSGGGRTCVIRRGGQVACWGGWWRSDQMQPTAAPFNVANVPDATYIDVSALTACAVRAGGQGVCWGHNNVGQLGDGTHQPPPDEFTPVPYDAVPHAVSGLGDAVQIRASDFHGCARRATGQAVCWGANGGPYSTSYPGGMDGMVGDGTTVDRLAPVGVQGLASSIAVDTSTYRSCAIRAGGQAACWGSPGVGYLGDGSNVGASAPVDVRLKPLG